MSFRIIPDGICGERTGDRIRGTTGMSQLSMPEPAKAALSTVSIPTHSTDGPQAQICGPIYLAAVQARAKKQKTPNLAHFARISLLTARRHKFAARFTLQL